MGVPVNVHILSSWDDERVKQLCELHAANITFSEIGDIIGMSRNACIGKAQRLGLPSRATELTVEERYARSQAKLAALRARRERANEVAKKKRTGQRAFVAYKPRVDNDLADKALHLEFDDLGAGHCRFPYGDGPFTFCGHQKLANTSYCESHFFFCLGGNEASA